MSSRNRRRDSRKLQLNPSRVFPLDGGLDLVSAPSETTPGRLLYSQNYEPGPSGKGLRRVQGYERTSGFRPSLLDYYIMNFTSGAVEPSAGDILSNPEVAPTGKARLLIAPIVTSGTWAGGDAAGYYVVSWSQPSSEALFDWNDTNTITDDATGLLDHGIVNGAVYKRAASTVALDRTYLKNSHDYWRTQVTAIPGSGNFVGLAVHKVKTPAPFADFTKIITFRDNGAGVMTPYHIRADTADLYSNQVVTMTVGANNFYDYLLFDTGTAEIFPGDQITGVSSGHTAYVKYVNVYDGVWASGTAKGCLILVTGVGAKPITGSFTAGEQLQVSSTNVAKVDTTYTKQSYSFPNTVAAIKMSPEGGVLYTKYREDDYYSGITGVPVFFSTGSTDGTDATVALPPTFFFDGLRFGPVFTGYVNESTNIPAPATRMVHHQGHAFWGFNTGVVHHSSLNDLFDYEVITGALAVQLGEEVTNMRTIGDEALLLAGRNTLGILYGTSAADWTNDKLKKLEESAGALPDTFESIATNIFLDDRGITSLSSAQEYGNFASNTIASEITPLIENKRNTIISSSISRTKVHYRLFCDDGFVIVIAFDKKEPVAYATLKYDIQFDYVISFEAPDGAEIICGLSQGLDYFYRLDSGRSFDGAAIEAFFRSSFIELNNPMIQNDFKSVIFNMDAEEVSSIKLQATFDYDTPEIPGGLVLGVDKTIYGGGGYWNAGVFNEFLWNGQVMTQAKEWLPGQGHNCSIVVYHSSAEEAVHTFKSLQFIYVPMRVTL